MSDCNSQITNGFRPCECPLNITDLNVSGFTDPNGGDGINAYLGYIVIGDVYHPIGKVGRIEGTDWLVFGIHAYPL